MVSLLIVSHSRQIAAGIKELADQMTGGRVPIVAVGGTADGRIGTNPDGIRAGFDAVAGPDGVLVLIDLGSAHLSAETALEGVTYPFYLSNAPLVEGAILAAVEASVEGDLRRTAAAAERAADLQKLGDEPVQPPRNDNGASLEVILTVDHPAGLHLRPAARFVSTAARFSSDVRIQNLSRPNAPLVDAKSMLGLMQSGVGQGHSIRVCADGPDADAAVRAIRELVRRNFEET